MTELDDFKYEDGLSVADCLDLLQSSLTAMHALQGIDPDELSTETLEAAVAALKRVEKTAETVRKDRLEDALEAVPETELRTLERRTGRHTYVTDTQAALQAVADAGHDPIEVADVKVGRLREVLGDAVAEDYLDSSEYTYHQERE